MSDLYILSENTINGSNHVFLSYITVASIISGLLVITSKNPIVSVLFLIGLFLTISAYLMMLGLNFLGLTYILVYVGAVSILFLFIIMLINVRISELVNDSSNSLPLAILIGIVFNSILYIDNIVSLFTHPDSIIKKAIYKSDNFFSVSNNVNYLNNTESSKVFNDLSYVSSNTWDASLAETSHITAIGNVIYTTYPIWLIITSIILLLAMVGAIVITVKQKS